MSVRDLIVKVVNRACRLPVIGPWIVKAKVLWRTMVCPRPSLRDLMDYQAMAIQGLELHAKHLENLNKRCHEKLGWLAVDNDNLRARIEYIRTEMMFELRRFVEAPGPRANSNTKMPATIVNREKTLAPGPRKLNVGCGHVLKDGYINVDGRQLPGVDVVCDVLDMPAELSGVDEIYAAHLVEHFSDLMLSSRILPDWFDRLKPGGKLVLVAPNAEAMMKRFCANDINFAQVKEVLFGGQEYEGDFHYTMLSPVTMAKMLESVGFKNVDFVTEDRINGACMEFEICAEKPCA